MLPFLLRSPHIALEQKTWSDNEIKKIRFIQSAQSIDLVDTVFEELVTDKSFIETCNFLRSHAIRHDQQNREKAARQIHNTNQVSGNTKKDNGQTSLSALVNEFANSRYN